MDDHHRKDFSAFCAQASDKQLLGIEEKESQHSKTDPYRRECLKICQAEVQRRSLLR